jgi:hypothetical protein
MPPNLKCRNGETENLGSLLFRQKPGMLRTMFHMHPPKTKWVLPQKEEAKPIWCSIEQKTNPENLIFYNKFSGGRKKFQS